MITTCPAFGARAIGTNAQLPQSHFDASGYARTETALLLTDFLSHASINAGDNITCGVTSRFDPSQQAAG